MEKESKEANYRRNGAPFLYAHSLSACTLVVCLHCNNQSMRFRIGSLPAWPLDDVYMPVSAYCNVRKDPRSQRTDDRQQVTVSDKDGSK